jgi:hypothetical protein
VVYLYVQEYYYIIVMTCNIIVWYIESFLRSIITESSLVRTGYVINFSTVQCQEFSCTPTTLRKHFSFFFVCFHPGDVIDRIDLLEKKFYQQTKNKRSSLLSFFALMKFVLFSV